MLFLHCNSTYIQHDDCCTHVRMHGTIHTCPTVKINISGEAAARASEAEERQRHRDGQIDADLMAGYGWREDSENGASEPAPRRCNAGTCARRSRCL